MRRIAFFLAPVLFLAGCGGGVTIGENVITGSGGNCLDDGIVITQALSCADWPSPSVVSCRGHISGDDHVSAVTACSGYWSASLSDTAPSVVTCVARCPK